MKKGLFIFFLVFSVSLFSINLNLTGAGARAAGMGGAFISIADDATAITWNPAGLAQLERPEISFVTRMTGHSIRYKHIQNNIDNKIDLNYFKLNFISGVYPFKIGEMNLTTSVSVQDQLDFDNEIKDEYGTTTATESGSANTFNLGFGLRLSNAFSIGLAFNKWYGNYEYNDKNTGQKEIMTVSGKNIGTGIMFDLKKTGTKLPMKLGLSYKKPFLMTIKNKRYTYELNMPAMIGFGTSFRIGESFTLSFDYEIRNYRDKKLKFINNDQNNSSEGKLSYFDLNQVRIGAEYLIVTDFAVLPLRVGFYNYPTTGYILTDNNEKKQVLGSGLSLGSGLIFNRFSLDFAVTYAGYNAETDQEELTNGKASIVTSLIFYF